MSSKELQTIPLQPQAGAMEDELQCGVCHEVYTAGRRDPVVLPSCGHAFCRSCLSKLEKDSVELGRLFLCPTCRTPHTASNPVHALPPVFALLHLSENYGKTIAEGKGRCASHGFAAEFWCCECRAVLCGHCLLEGHVKEGHDVQAAHSFLKNQRRDVQTTGAWLKWELDQMRRTMLWEMTRMVTRLVVMAQRSQVLHDLNGRLAKVLEETDQAATLEGITLASTLMGSLEGEIRKTLGKEATPLSRTLLRCRSCIEAPNSALASGSRQGSISEADYIEASMGEAIGPGDSEAGNASMAAGGEDNVVVETNTPCRHEEVEAEAGQDEDGFQAASGEESDGGAAEEAASTVGEWAWPVRCSVTAGGDLQGRLCWEDGRMHAYALALPPHAAAHLLVQLPYLRSLEHGSQPEVFLDLATGKSVLGRLYIKLWGHLRRAQHFLSLCMGANGPSYRGSKFHGVVKKGSMGETLAGGRYVTHDGGNSVQGLIAGLEWGGQYMREKVAGLVVAASAGSPEADAFFHICTQGHPGHKFACAFGEVCAGMEVVQKAVDLHPVHGVRIVECGLVLPRPPGIRVDTDLTP
ncbi:Peptidyl-prolyl cis-trans isomerase B1 [Chionoecetes opilio]|uniref:Peptidyl-prolyl cis-trans isomerase B1 n=1 Tax=Chionoecetes opilio TaxID=41210 RepID=A0A8J4YHA2_CHIOP|nr:Peptidyl-prolyl cis-trans isomerase B1 [Chionoecetes opilio]